MAETLGPFLPGPSQLQTTGQDPTEYSSEALVAVPGELTAKMAAQAKHFADAGIWTRRGSDLPLSSNGYFHRMGFHRYGYGCLGNCSSTPASDGTHVWAAYGSNAVACYDVATGRCKWMNWVGPSRSGGTWRRRAGGRPESENIKFFLFFLWTPASHGDIVQS